MRVNDFGTVRTRSAFSLLVCAVTLLLALALLSGVGAAPPGPARGEAQTLGNTITLPVRITQDILKETGPQGDQVNLPGFQAGGKPGDPALPAYEFCFLLPENVSFEKSQFSIENEVWEDVPGAFDVAPAPPAATRVGGNLVVEWGGKDPANIVQGRDVTVYGKDAFFPASPLGGAQISKYRPWNLAYVTLTGVAYNPVQKQLRVLRSATIRLTCELGPQPQAAPAAGGFAPPAKTEQYWSRLRERVANPGDRGAFYPALVAPAPGGPAASAVTANYVIITTDWIKTNSTKLTTLTTCLANRGYTTSVITEAIASDDTHYLQGNTCATRAANIRGWLKSNYATIDYVLLIGDPDPGVFTAARSIPMLTCYPNSADHSTAVPTDLCYAELSGSWDLDADGFPGEYTGDFAAAGIDKDSEVAVGRVPYYGTLADLDSILQKIARYENATTDLDWRYKTLIPSAVSNVEQEYAPYNGFPDPPTTIVSHGGEFGKAMNATAKAYSFNTYRLYEWQGCKGRNNSDCPNPANFPSEAALTQANLQAEWQNNYGFVTWWGHGNSTGASRMWWANDNYTQPAPFIPTLDSVCQMGSEDAWLAFWQSSDCAQLNDDHPSFVFQVSCDNGYPETTNNLGYSLLKQGAIATLSASRISWYGIGSWSTGWYASVGDNASFAYYAYDRMAGASSQKVGDALNWCRSNFGFAWGWQSWMNRLDFNLYGEPACTYLGPAHFFWKEYEGHYLADIDQKQDNWKNGPQWTWCGPVAEADSIWWFGQRFPNLLPDQMTPTQLVAQLAGLMNTDDVNQTDPHIGTKIADLYTGVKQYLQNHNATSTIEVHYIPRTGTDIPPTVPPTFDQITSEVLKCQDVTLLLGFWEVTNITSDTLQNVWVIQWQRVGGHYVSCAGVSTDTLSLAISDPYYDAAEDGLTTGAIRGSNHTHPDGHNDGSSASHDVYRVQVNSLSPGGYFSLPGYVGNPSYFEYANENDTTPRITTATITTAAAPVDLYEIHTEVEYAVAISPIVGGNNPPVVTTPGPQTTSLDLPLVFSAACANAITVSDADAGAADILTTLSVTNGTLALGSVPGGLTVTGDGTSQVGMKGPQADITAALDGLTFTPTAGFTGSAPLVVAANDLGNTGFGGPQFGSGTIQISVTEVFWKTWQGFFLPDFDQKQDNWQNAGKWSWCGPVAEANSIWWFDKRFPSLVDDPTTPGGLITELAWLMNTDSVQGGIPHAGTFVTDLYSGVKQYLINHQCNDKLEVHWVPNTGGDAPPLAPPSFDDISSEVLKCQDVTLLLGFWQVTGVNPDPAPPHWVINWERVGGHYVSCAGVSSNTLKLVLSDPYRDAAEDATTTGAIRGLNHIHPLGHNDGVSASHDAFLVDKSSISPGGSFWLVDYKLLNPYEFYGQNGSYPDIRVTHVDIPAPPLFGDVHAEVEYAVAVSPFLPPDVTITTPTLTTRRGGPATTGGIGHVSDDRDPPGSLFVSAAFVPPATGMLLSVTNQNGTVTALTTATAASAAGVYPAVLTVTDSNALVTTAGFTVSVLPNLVPTLGTYADVTVTPGASTVAHPSAPPEDGNGNITSVVVAPTALPGGGTLSVNPTTGDVSIVTVAGTQAGDHLATVTVTDSCGDYVEQSFTLGVGSPPDITTTTLGLTTRRGGPSTTGEIAHVSDDKDSSGSLLVSAAFVPAATGMLLSVSNQNGTVTAVTTATAASAAAVYPAVLTVTDSDALVTTAGFTVTVQPNLVPTLGTYANVTVTPGSSTVAHPSAPPEDGNGNITSVVVAPTTLPGGGTLSVNSTTGDVSIVTVAGTQKGDHLTTVTVTDSCGDYVERSFKVQVGSPPTIAITNSPVALGYFEEKVVNVATVSDLETAAGSLVVSVNQITPSAGLGVTVLNNAGTVAATISAAPTAPAGTYDVELQVLDGDGLSQLGTFQVILGRQPAHAKIWQLFE